MKIQSLLSGLVFLVFWSCSPQPKAIHYGQDVCHFCKMTIVDKQHGAELVTTKGKVYQFDAIECMVQFIQVQPELTFAFELVNDYEKPGDLIDASKSTFLICQDIPSPMGAYLSAFSDKLPAEKIASEKGGMVYTYEALKSHLKK